MLQSTIDREALAHDGPRVVGDARYFRQSRVLVVTEAGVAETHTSPDPRNQSLDVELVEQAARSFRLLCVCGCHAVAPGALAGLRTVVLGADVPAVMPVIGGDHSRKCQIAEAVRGSERYEGVCKIIRRVRAR
jgi:hypothetical protein